MFIDYNEIVENYNKNLDENLRGFTGGPGFLETWTHDEDINRSVGEIIDLAVENKLLILNMKMHEEQAGKVQLGGYKDGVITITGGNVIQYLSREAVDLHGYLLIALADEGLTNTFFISDIVGEFVTLSYEENKSEFSDALIRVERAVKRLSEKKYILQSEDVEDKNKRENRITH